MNMQNGTKMFNIKIKWCIQCLNTKLEPGILESEVKWALEDIAKNKWAGVDKITAKWFTIFIYNINIPNPNAHC